MKDDRCIRVCTVCGDPYDANDDRGYCPRCSNTQERAFEIRKEVFGSMAMSRDDDDSDDE